MKINSATWSNLFFLAPIFLALNYHLYFHFLLLLIAIIISTLFHFAHRNLLGKFDITLALLVITNNFRLVYLSRFHEPYFLIAILLVLISFYYFFVLKKDDWEWHLLCSLITVLCILGYTSYLKML